MEKGTQLPYPIQESCAMLVGSPGGIVHGTSSIMKHRCSRYSVVYWTVEQKAPTLRLKRKGETSFKPHRYIDPHQEIGSLVRQTKAYKGLHIHSLRQLHGGRKLEVIDV